MEVLPQLASESPRTGALITPAAFTSDEQVLLASWLHGRSIHTTRAYQANVARFLAYVEKPLTAVTLLDLQAYADALAAAEAALSPASQVRMLAALKSLFTFAHKTGYLSFNVG